jgi:hypothetical protein
MPVARTGLGADRTPATALERHGAVISVPSRTNTRLAAQWSRGRHTVIKAAARCDDTRSLGPYAPRRASRRSIARLDNDYLRMATMRSATARAARFTFRAR